MVVDAVSSLCCCVPTWLDHSFREMVKFIVMFTFLGSDTFIGGARRVVLVCDLHSSRQPCPHNCSLRNFCHMHIGSVVCFWLALFGVVFAPVAAALVPGICCATGALDFLLLSSVLSCFCISIFILGCSSSS